MKMDIKLPNMSKSHFTQLESSKPALFRRLEWTNNVQRYLEALLSNQNIRKGSFLKKKNQ